MKLQLAFHLVLLTILQLYHLPPLPPSSQKLLLSVHSILAPVFQLLYCTIVLFKFLYYKIKNVYFCLLFLCTICVESITVQYYIANCVSWLPRLTMSGLQKNWT